MMEQGVSNLQRSEFHSSCSWEKYIIHSSLEIKWSSAFSFLPVLCTREKLWVVFFFLFLSFPYWKHCWAQSSSQGARDLGDTWASITPLVLGKQRYLVWAYNSCKSWWHFIKQKMNKEGAGNRTRNDFATTNNREIWIFNDAV